MLMPAASLAGSPLANALRQDQVFELRQYTLHGHLRDDLIALFEAHFIASQEALGAHVVGTFRDLDDPDRFVWIRGFADMAARQAALTAFYSGPVWQAHRTTANATMLDSDNVLLLKSMIPTVAPAAATITRHRRDALYGARIFSLANVDAAAFATFFATTMLPLVRQSGADPIATFVSEATPNNFPALPVRGDRVFVWMARWPRPAAEQDFENNWHRLTGWRDAIPEALLPALMRKPERLRLVPTDHSALK